MLGFKKQGTEERLSKNDLGLFFGIPIAVSDSIDWKGFPSSHGISYLSDDLKAENSYVIKLILKEGGIPLVKANVS